ncbi:hypothetical protein BVC80_9099g85 [Macleaya cordata]|uniref:Uncharacterized protein n=1 Tax=Macleaya cordata TaxID=56857 RepID=A0A200PVP6_MACCD|nr:hypothetical protein BVC80_9099g85 [Macleaya cordata]
MNTDPEILEISSDEDGDIWAEPNDDQIDWLSELLDSADSLNEDSDEVVFVSEVSGSSVNQKQSNKPWDPAKAAVVRDDSDDECMILDKDPDNPVSVANDTENGSDELLIVGEKGQLACRDYPHSRHQCARFPFSTSPHEKYCDLCHCYVCDSRAPCIYWGTGVSKTDHCNSTDKEERWRIQRKCFKQGTTIQPPLRKFPETLPLHESGPTLSASHPLGSGSFPPHSVSSTRIHSCSSLASFGVPSIISRRNTNSQQSAALYMGRNRFPHHVSRSQLMPAGTSNNINRRGRERGGVTLGPLHTNFKRIGPVGVGALPKNRSTYSSSNDNHVHKSRPKKIYQPPMTLQDGIHSQKCQDIFEALDSMRTTCKSLSQPNMSTTSSSADVLYSSQTNENLQNMYPNLYPFLNVTDPNPPDPDLGWLNEITTECPFPAAENSQIPGLQPTSVPLPDSGEPFYPQESVNPGQSELDSWIDSLANQTVFGPANDAVQSHSDFVSSQPDLMNESFLFDFEKC